jgi:hypothetical protein
MQLGATHTVTIGDLRFAIRMTWGKYRQILRETDALRKADSTSELVDAMSRYATECVVGVEGLQDSSGQPVAWSATVVDELPPEVMQELFGRLLAPAEGEGADPTPA